MKILFIDDDEIFSQNICELLLKAGHTVEYCKDTNDAIRVIGTVQYDLYIIDLILPPTYENEGINILKEIKKDNNQNKAIMISQKNHNMTSIVDLAYQLGARRFIDKTDSGFSIKILTIVKEITKEMNDAIFISYGHNELLMLKLKSFISEKLEKRILVLSEIANKGMTIVEKLEAASERCNKAIVLLTKDDETRDGGMRARQNVVHEIGFFQGKYGRENVILLCEDGVELFSNISGIVYYKFDEDHFDEIYELLRSELS